ncbi:MAG: MoaD/ThiS family protein [bacterium]
MIQVELELWLGSGSELGEEFQVLSPVRSRTIVEIPEGTSLWQLLRTMASRNPRLQDLLLDQENSCLRSDLVILKNNRLDSRSKLLNEVLKEGDQIRLVPIYAGG